jgi:RNA polymerase sigma-B factor
VIRPTGSAAVHGPVSHPPIQRRSFPSTRTTARATNPRSTTPRSTDPRGAAETRLATIAQLPADDTERSRLRREVVEEQLPLVHHLAQRFRGRGEPYDDLVQVGTIGLLHAVDRYNPDRGGSFTTFAVPTILGEIRRHFRDRGWAMRVPRRMQDLARQVSEARELLTHRLDRSPTVHEIARQLGTEVDLVLEALETAGAYATVPLPTSENDVDLGYFGAIDEALEHVENREALRPMLDRLSARERRILALRFGRGLSQSQIAAEIGVSQMHVSRLLTRSIASLRRGFTEEV